MINDCSTTNEANYTLKCIVIVVIDALSIEPVQQMFCVAPASSSNRSPDVHQLNKDVHTYACVFLFTENLSTNNVLRYVTASTYLCFCF